MECWWRSRRDPDPAAGALDDGRSSRNGLGHDSGSRALEIVAGNKVSSPTWSWLTTVPRTTIPPLFVVSQCRAFAALQPAYNVAPLPDFDVMAIGSLACRLQGGSRTIGPRSRAL